MRTNTGSSTPTALFLTLTLFLTTACQFKGAPTSERAPSFRPYEAVHIGDQPLEEFIQRRSALLIRDVKTDPDDPLQFIGEISATATPITSDGYFLTAAHALSEKVLYIRPGPDDTTRKLRVVWNGRVDGNGEDLALVHAPYRGLEFLTMAHDDEIREGQAVVGGGCTGGSPTVVGGLLLDSEKQGAVRILSHDAPVRTGDSGGPLISLRGRLLGIIVGGVYNPLKLGSSLTGRAVRPEFAAILELIEQDRVRPEDD